MNIALAQRADPTQVTAIRRDNDRFRQGDDAGALLLSPGVIGLGATTQARIIDAIRAFDDFEDDDPSDTHAIGDFEVPLCSPVNNAAKPTLIFFRIDPAPAPCGSRVLTIMLTIMLASEW